MQLSTTQKKTLNLLLHRYENSITYKGQNKINQSFSCKPEEILIDYRSDSADIQIIDQFEVEMQELATAGFVQITRTHGEIRRITLSVDAVDDCRKKLGIEDKRSILKRHEEILLCYRDMSEMLHAICVPQLERLNQYKMPNLIKEIELLEDVLRCIAAIEQNTVEYMEREFSISLFGDTKYFEKKIKTAVCKQLLLFSEFGSEIIDSFDEEHRNNAILACYQIVQNPSYIYLKGNGIIVFADGMKMQLSAQYPIALSSETVSKIEHIQIIDNTVMTIENLTSYHRMPCDGNFLVYLSGYHNHIKTLFLRKIAADNDILHWLHFGDIDPDGFQILMSLAEKTGLPFHPTYMSLADLKRHRTFWKKLTSHDRKTAEKLLHKSQYAEIMSFCIENNCKLEQERISWEIFQR